MTQTSKDLERVVRRTGMNRGQVTLLKYLYEKEDDFVSRDEIVEDIRWGDAESFTGVLAAFSNRVNGTEGIMGNPGYEAFIERRDIGGEEHFRLRKEARKAIGRVEKLLETFERPMGELLEKKGVPVEFEDFSLAETYVDEEDRDKIGWTPSSPEDRLLKSYWEEVGGTVVTEVQTGGSGSKYLPEGAKRWRIDGVRFDSSYRDEIVPPTAFTKNQLCDIVQDRHVEVIEVKQSLNRVVVGQAIAGRDLFDRDYGPVTVEPVVVCGSGDPALEWVCRKNGVRVEIVEADSD